MKINPTALTITQLLSNEAEQFVVPAYQRRYSWHPKHIAELFDDINLLENGEDHLLGSIVCLTSSHGVGINQLELVDGQQRTTTIMLFLNAMEEKYKILGKNKEAEKLGNYLYCTDFDGKQKNKLELGDLDRADYSLIIDNKDLQDVINKRLLEGHRFILSLVDKLTSEELDLFKYKFINQASVIRLDVAESKDAFKLFETINNRGLSLSPTDIIKNFLLGNASLIDDATLMTVKKNWTQLIVCMDGLNLDDFFRQYMNGLLGRKVTYTMLIDTFKKYFVDNVVSNVTLARHVEYTDKIVSEANQDSIIFSDVEENNESGVVDVIQTKKLRKQISITDFVTNLRKSAEVYSKILNHNFGDQKIDQHMINLQKIRSFASYTFILNLMQRKIDRNEQLVILKILETFMLRRNISEYRTAELDDIFSNLTSIEDTNIVEKVKDTLIHHLPGDKEFEAKITEHDFRGLGENRAKYMLEQIEYYITGNTDEKYIGGGEDVHLEHIMPQTITTKKSKEEFGDWEKYLGNNALVLHKEKVVKLGNMTLLSAPLNIKASNNPFLAKKLEYAKSIIQITRKLRRFDEFKFEQIDRRSKELAHLSVKIWKF
jgi:uncharacterized protein with ParB-like and HNH nuclease domain